MCLPDCYSMRFTTRITIWVIDWWCNVYLFTWWIDTRFLLKWFDIRNWWIWTGIDYHPCITNETTNQYCFSRLVHFFFLLCLTENPNEKQNKLSHIKFISAYFKMRSSYFSRQQVSNVSENELCKLSII